MSTVNPTLNTHHYDQSPEPPVEWTFIGLNADVLAQKWGWFVAMGAVTLIAGLAAIALPHVAALTVNLLLGAVLVVHGIVQGIHAFFMRGLKGFVWQVLGALAAIVVGSMLLVYPIAGVVSLTLVVAVFLTIIGGLKTGMAFRLKPLRGWGWLAFNGVLVGLLGVLILAQFPQVVTWVLGLLVGIDMVLSGAWLSLVGLDGRKLKTAS